MEKKRKDVDPNKMDRKDDYYFQNWLIYMYFLKIFIIISIFIQYFFFTLNFKSIYLFLFLFISEIKDIIFFNGRIK